MDIKLTIPFDDAVNLEEFLDQHSGSKLGSLKTTLRRTLDVYEKLWPLLKKELAKAAGLDEEEVLPGDDLSHGLGLSDFFISSKLYQVCNKIAGKLVSDPQVVAKTEAARCETVMNVFNLIVSKCL